MCMAQAIYSKFMEKYNMLAPVKNNRVAKVKMQLLTILVLSDLPIASFGVHCSSVCFVCLSCTGIQAYWYGSQQKGPTFCCSSKY